MSKLLRFLSSETLIITVISLLVMLINITPFLYRLHNTPPDREFTGAQFYTLDYNIYLGHFKEGAEGVWLTHNKHSSEPHSGFLLRREYVIWGFLTGYLLHLPIIYVYHSARIFAGFLLLFVIYLLIREVFPDKKNGNDQTINNPHTPTNDTANISDNNNTQNISSIKSNSNYDQNFVYDRTRNSVANFLLRPFTFLSRVLFSATQSISSFISASLRVTKSPYSFPLKYKRIFAFLFATVVAGFPIYRIDPQTGKTTVDLHLYWFLETDPTQRFATLFHYLLGNIILLSVIILFIRYLKSQNSQNTQKIFVPSAIGSDKKILKIANHPTIEFCFAEPSNHRSIFYSLLISILLCILAALIHPSTLVTIYLMFGIYWTINTIAQIFLSVFKKSNFKQYLKISLFIAAIVLFSAPSIFFLQSQVNTFPWTIISRWDKASRTPIDLADYIYAIGPIFFLGLLGISLILLKHLLLYIAFILHLLFTKKKAPNPVLANSNESTIKIATDQPIIKKKQLTIDEILTRNAPVPPKAGQPANPFIILMCFPLATFFLAFKLWPYLLDINRVRFLQVPIFVPFAIFSVIALASLIEVILPILYTIVCYFSKIYKKIFLHTNLSKKTTPATSQPIINKLSLLLLASCFLLLAFITFPAYKWGLNRELFMFMPNDGLIYQGKEWMKGLYWLNKNTKPEEAVMGAFLTNGLIPGFSGNFAYSGHPWNTVDYEKKEENLIKFFRIEFTPSEAQALLKKDHVNYIFYGYQEKSFGGDLTIYRKFLRPVYHTPEVTIYKVVL